MLALMLILWNIMMVNATLICKFHCDLMDTGGVLASCRVKVLNALTDPQKQLTGSFVSMEYCTQVITTLEQIMK
jgi:hypothetical protein